MEYRGWAYLDGRHLGPDDLRAVLEEQIPGASRLEGEFYFEDGSLRARDWLGIIPGDCPAGRILSPGITDRVIRPSDTPCRLEEAIYRAIRLRSGEGVTALSGGVDSALVAAIAGLPCITVGFLGSHDLERGQYAARTLGLECEPCILDDSLVKEHLPEIVHIAQPSNPVDLGIAATQYFIAWWAGELGHSRIVSGQGADEQFAGYSRYLTSTTLADDLKNDFGSLIHQVERDQHVAGRFGCYFSLPYLDYRVVRAVETIPPEEMIRNGIRKFPLREVARLHIPADIASGEKKAMQYGSGIWGSIRRLARHNGYKTSLKDYVNHLTGCMNRGH